MSDKTELLIRSAQLNLNLDIALKVVFIILGLYLILAMTFRVIEEFKDFLLRRKNER